MYLHMAPRAKHINSRTLPALLALAARAGPSRRADAAEVAVQGKAVTPRAMRRRASGDGARGQECQVQ